MRFLEECDGLPADGVVGTKDRSSLLAALVAERRGLPGPTPRALIACQFKPTARALQRATVPSATPRFALLDGRPPFGPPFFVKPVVGRLSQRVRRIDDPLEIEQLEEVDAYMTGYARIAALAGLHPDAVRGFLAEELLEGDEVTLEGYVFEGQVTTIGITDSVKYEGTNSFERFEYPSALPPERKAELTEVAARILPALGFDGSFFNVEFFVPSEGPARIIEVNARLASQFWPLVQAVKGRSTYEAMFRLACGDDPAWADIAPRRCRPLLLPARLRGRIRRVCPPARGRSGAARAPRAPPLRAGDERHPQLSPLHLPRLGGDARGGRRGGPRPRRVAFVRAHARRRRDCVGAGAVTVTACGR